MHEFKKDIYSHAGNISTIFITLFIWSRRNVGDR